MDYVNDFFTRHPGPVRPAMRTKRGDSLSVQGSAGHYCTPQEDGARYSAVEVWWSIRCPRPLRGHKRRGDNGPAGWVPVADVNAWIASRGGLDN